LVLAVAYYYVFLFFRGTRGAQVVVGLVILVAVLIGLTQLFNLDALNWILQRLSVFLGAALLIVFQPEIRRALAELGKQPVFSGSAARRSVVDAIVEAVSMLAAHRVGALIAIERDIGTRAVQETGVRVDAAVTPELLASLFFPHTPLHDGGAIISGSRIVAAGCVFPLSPKSDLHKQLGTRHRAGVGLSEETDAVVVIVSEETGTISVSYGGRLSRGLDEEQLHSFLAALLVKEAQPETVWQRVRKQLDLTPSGIARSESAEREKTGAH
jgi:diadenylate cyclase